MKFLCLPCDEVMAFAERQLPGDGTMTAVFTCPGCGRDMAMLANPMETQLVSSMGVVIGGRTVPGQPLEQTRSAIEQPRQDAFTDSAPSPIAESTSGPPARVTWADEAIERLERVPKFVRGMVKRIYTDYAQEHQIEVITVAVMDRARTDLGLEGM